MSDRAAPSLRREVLAPQRHSSGLGVVVVAASMMLLAVGGSALVVYQRAARNACEQPLPPTPAATTWQAQETPSEPPCSEPIYTRHADGTIGIVYLECAPNHPTSDLDAIRSANPATIQLGEIWLD